MGELTTLLNDVVLGVMDDRWRWTLRWQSGIIRLLGSKQLGMISGPCVSTQNTMDKRSPIKVNVSLGSIFSENLPHGWECGLLDKLKFFEE
ncbi:hypothetical protein Tco_1570977 [Tanacetum coccineum]